MSTESMPFDPETGEIIDAGGASNVAELTVSELSQSIKRSLEDTFGHVRVRGEVGRVSRPGSGHVYLDLKDDKSVLAAVIWKGTARALRFFPEQGMEVVVSGRITTFAGQSKYQIVIETLEPAGEGALMALLEERKKTLAAEGLFEAARKKPLPFLPAIIGVVTSPTGAVIRDILHRLADRFPRHVLVWPVRVQGESCAAEVAAAIAGFNALEHGGPIPRPDLLIVARGGGSLEDLWGFNEEIVVRAAAASAIPLISAVGHETDWTLIDLAADWRAPTPTAAAEQAVPVRSELAEQLGDLAQRNARGLKRAMSERRNRLTAAGRGLPRPDDILALARQRLDGAAGRLLHGLTAGVTTRRTRLAASSGRLSVRPIAVQIAHHRRDLARHGETARRGIARLVADRNARLAATAKLLGSLSYQSVLQRGYAVVHGPGDRPVTSTAAALPGLAVALEFADGRAHAHIDGEAPPRHSGKPSKNGGGQGSLF